MMRIFLTAFFALLLCTCQKSEGPFISANPSRNSVTVFINNEEKAFLRSLHPTKDLGEIVDALVQIVEEEDL